MVVVLDDDRIVLLREVRSGSVRYVAPSVAVRGDELPGQAAARAAREQLGIEVEIEELVFADTEYGSEHFYFLANPLSRLELDSTPEPISDGVSLATLERTSLLAYPIRPHGVAHRLRIASVSERRLPS